MTDFKAFYIQLQKNLNILLEREAKWAGQAPLDLLNQIEDHRLAIELTGQVIGGEISEEAWFEALAPLNLGINVAQRFFYDKFVIYPTGNHGAIIFPSNRRLTPQQRPRPVNQRPSLPVTLLDRRQEVNTAASSLLSAPQAVEFLGQAGIGKTTLLRYLAHHLPEVSFPDGVVYLSARRKSLPDLLQEIFDTFYKCDLPFKPAEAELQYHLKSLQAFILLDDVGLERDDVEALVDAVPACAILLASTEQHLYGGGRAVHLKGLPKEDALKLVEQELTALGQPLIAEEYSAVQEIWLILQGHPLHMLQVTIQARTMSRSLGEVVAQLRETPSELKRAAMLLAPFSPLERQVLSVLDAMEGATLSPEQLGAITGVANPILVLETLLKNHLIQSDGLRYKLADTLSQALHQEQDAGYWAERAFNYFIDWAEEHRQVPELLQKEIEALQQALNWAVKTERWPETLRLFQTVESSAALAGRWDAWEQLLQAGLRAAQVLGDRAAEALALHQLGVRAVCLGDTALATSFLTRALRVREQLGDQTGAAMTRHNLELLMEVSKPPQSPPQSHPKSSSVYRLWLFALVAAGAFTCLFITLAGIGGFFARLIWYQSTPTVPPTKVIAAKPSATPAISTSTPTAVTIATLVDTLPSRTPTPTPSPTPTPTATLAPPSEPEDILFEADDGTELVGTYYPPPICPSPLTVVYFPWVRGDKNDWLEFVSFLPAELSYGAFSITHRPCAGGCQSSQNYEREGWQQDYLAALARAEELPCVNKDRIVTIGVSIGADGAIFACGQKENCLAALSISPNDWLGTGYAREVEAMVTNQKPVWMIYSEGDSGSSQVRGIAPNDYYRPFNLSGNEHGNELFDNQEMMAIAQDFLECAYNAFEPAGC